MNMSDFTILICNYNHGRYLKKLLDSIHQQSLQPSKIIIIDDGSTDNSHTILQNYKNSEKFKIILNKENKGVICRMNEGIVLINTEYFMVYGADDFIINKESIHISISALKQYPEAGLSTCLVSALSHEYKDSKFIRTPILSKKIKYFSPKNFLKIVNNVGPCINGHMTVVRTKFFKKVVNQYPNIDNFTDISAFYSIAINYGIVFIPKILGSYRVLEDGYGQGGFKNKYRTIRNQLKMFKILKKKKIS